MAITTDSSERAAVHFHRERMPNSADIFSASGSPSKIFYNFHNHFHPFVGDLLQALNKKSLSGMMDVNFHKLLESRGAGTALSSYQPNSSEDQSGFEVLFEEGTKKKIDISIEGSYSLYNWELFFHCPLAIATHLSKTQRFAEAQKWFHFIFDPTCTDTHVPVPQRFWKFLAFRDRSDVQWIDEMLRTLSSPEDSAIKQRIEGSIEKWREAPFEPHVIAQSRLIAYQLYVVMKYLDNLIAWGDSLFQQDTIETLNEATQLYVLAASILGPKPQELPRKGIVRPKTFAQLRSKLDALGNALVDLEGQFPFNLSLPSVERVDFDRSNSLFGTAESLYFCIPQNDKLLSYWNIVADRLFKIRHCMSIEGMVRQLPLFQPPLDPGMLVKAAAVGINVSGILSGRHHPLSPIRSTLMIQKALEICNEVRSLGNAFLSALEKKDGEAISQLRQGQEIQILEMVKDIRYLQWKEAESNTESLLKTRASVFHRYQHYQTLLGKKGDKLKKLATLNIQRKALTEDNFDEIYSELVGNYAKTIKLTELPFKEQAGDSSPSNQSGATGQGVLNLNRNEDMELNEKMSEARTFHDLAYAHDILTAGLYYIPNFKVKASYWGVGGDIETGGQFLGNVGKAISDSLRIIAEKASHEGTIAAKTAGYERRAEDWILQSNLAAKELMQIGRQIIASLIREQIAKKEYDNQQQQIDNAKEIQVFLQEKFTNEELYSWMQGELSRVYYDGYKFAFEIAKKAELTMKYELMRPELDKAAFVKFNYWDAGRKGLLSGEALYLDLKRMEMAYHEYNKREFELSKHISLRQLNPMALLQLKTEGACEITMPEWLFDLDTPGHYMRRIKTVAISIPAVAGPYTSINCTLSLQKSTIRRSAMVEGLTYARAGSEDERFIDYLGTIQSIVTSNAQQDTGLFETNLRDERFLPFEGAGVESSWKLELPTEFRQFDYSTISDVIIHFRYTARPGGERLKQEANAHLREILGEVEASGLERLFSLKHDFPNNWHKFSKVETTAENFKFTIKKDHFPYFTQGFKVKILGAKLFIMEISAEGSPSLREFSVDMDGLLSDQGELSLEFSEIPEESRSQNAEVFMIMKYELQN